MGQDVQKQTPILHKGRLNIINITMHGFTFLLTKYANVLFVSLALIKLFYVNTPVYSLRIQ